ncbi:MAG: ABC transporter ATP-binding protein, partial [Chloroflexi bacterium]|nr:ABC transporter ATP-binding protein [Chloroflexota bacterium]
MTQRVPSESNPRETPGTSTPSSGVRPLVSVRGLSKSYSVGGGLFGRRARVVDAVHDVSFEIGHGERLGLVGESGCGKTTTGKLLVNLIPPTAGQIVFQDGEDVYDVATLRGKGLKSYRRMVQMIFQDPYEAINPRMTVLDVIAEPLKVQGVGNPLERIDRVSDMLDMVGITPPGGYLFRRPHELSGGQRQRVAIARALVVGPRFVVADEPTSMLDVSVRVGVTKLMRDLADQMGISYLYITHDLATARYICDRIAVMYLGSIVEVAETEELLRNPQHPYTKALVSAVPVPDPTYKRPPVDLKGNIGRPIDLQDRCRFYDRCPMAVEFCRAAPPP